MDLIILRHGEAGKSVDAASRDAERALTVSGRKEVEEVAEGLARLKVEVGCIATSPLKRAKETANIAAKVLKNDDLVEVWDELRPEAETTELYRRLSKLKGDSGVLLVGHEPYLGKLIALLAAGNSSLEIDFKKGGLCKLEAEFLLYGRCAKLVWLLTPRQMELMT